MRKAGVLVLVVLLSVISLTGFPGAQAARGGEGIQSSVLPMVPPKGTPVAQDLLDLMGNALDQTPIPVIVQLSSPVTPAVLSHLQAVAGPFSAEGSWPHALPGAFLTRMPPAQIQRLAQVPGILRIEPDRPVEAFLDTATLWTGVQQARRDFGVTGSGITVAIIDTGIDTGHGDLPPGKVVGWYDAVQGKPSPYDMNSPAQAPDFSPGKRRENLV